MNKIIKTSNLLLFNVLKKKKGKVIYFHNRVHNRKSPMFRVHLVSKI